VLLRRLTACQPSPGNSEREIVEIDVRIAIVKDNLRELVEQSASYSGAADDELMSQRIAEQEAELELLRKRRDELLSQTGS
jgi:predicted RNA-binding protein